MKKVHTKQHPFLLVLMLLFLTISAQKGAKSLANAAALKVPDGCNATRIGDCMTDDEEFLMESETSRRFLGGGGDPISNDAQNRNKPFCNQKLYGNCIGRPNKIDTRRGCNYRTCRRDVG
ncbi:hypothetical protein CDL12_24876 [Handroanthus impetiginosus]|uniref:Rapid ALkalinization Factor n=1 Tax=Handroanthus impetiginosus TaxID=429701 RepID=A0A2G9GBQ0_9LAMI|nr:hypothetical protein CDL12_24876 [Handroanthus impetiginosus]